MKNNKNNYQILSTSNKQNIVFLYFAVTGISLIISLCTIYIKHGTIWDRLVFGDGHDTFMDFFNHISYVSRAGRKYVYEQSPNACFPPLAYVFYGFLAHLIPRNSTVIGQAPQTGPFAYLLYTFYNIINASLFFYAITKYLKNKLSLAITLSIFFSNVFIIGVLERGNSTWIVCILLLYAIIFRQSKSIIKKELALVFIAIAAGFKVYPAIFGLLYILEKKWKEAIRLLFYGLFFFFTPFLFFGGMHGLEQFINNQIWLQNLSTNFGTINYLANYLHNYIQISPNNLHNILLGFFIICSIISMLYNEDFWKIVYIITALMIIIPKWSQFYTMIYVVVPLVLFIKNLNKSHNSITYNCIIMFLFAIIFSNILYLDFQFTSHQNYGFNSQSQNVFQLVSIWILLFIIYFESFFKFTKAISRHHIESNKKASE